MYYVGYLISLILQVKGKFICQNNFAFNKKTRTFALQITRVMTTKLTLTVEKEVIDLAKAYASKKGRSLSDLIENYLKTLVQKENDKMDFSADIKRLLGSVKAPKDFDYKKELGNALSKKYSK